MEISLSWKSEYVSGNGSRTILMGLRGGSKIASLGIGLALNMSESLRPETCFQVSVLGPSVLHNLGQGIPAFCVCLDVKSGNPLILGSDGEK
jgi:hypothetical protein